MFSEQPLSRYHDRVLLSRVKNICQRYYFTLRYPHRSRSFMVSFSPWFSFRDTTRRCTYRGINMRFFFLLIIVFFYHIPVFSWSFLEFLTWRSEDFPKISYWDNIFHKMKFSITKPFSVWLLDSSIGLLPILSLSINNSFYTLSKFMLWVSKLCFRPYSLHLEKSLKLIFSFCKISIFMQEFSNFIFKALYSYIICAL